VAEKSPLRGIPRLKKDISTFVLSEEGKMSKKNALAIGTFVASSMMASALMAETVEAGQYIITNKHIHTNSSGMAWDHASESVLAEHTNHTNHQNHNNCVGKGC